MEQPQADREVAALFEQARRTAQGTPPRKHHLVPASYLRRWEDEGRLRVTHLDEGRTWLSPASHAARETDFYRIEHDNIDPEDLPPLLMETMLGRLEGTAKVVVDELIADGQPASVDPDQLLEFAWHLALQFTRGHAVREEQRALAADEARMSLSDVPEAGIRGLLEERGIEPTPELIATHRAFLDNVASGEVVATPARAQLVGMAAAAAEPLTEHLLGRHWRVYETPRVLVTSDEPVVPVAGPGRSRRERPGIAVAAAVLHPLSPSRLLVMFRPDVHVRPPFALTHLELAEVNREILGSTSRWAFERPSRKVTLRMRVPPAPQLAMLRVGPVQYERERQNGELYGWHRPTRWASLDGPPPWPVERWWR